MLVNCKQNADTNLTQSEVPPAASTQAILKVQPILYNDKSKTTVVGDYVDMDKIEVPKTLSGQNKWIMFEGPVLENDKVAYRFYADARHRSDIYGKKVSDLVMDTVSWNYHNLMDWGSDILKVGNSLGIGSPGILYRDSVYALESWDKKVIEVIKSGGTTSTIRTTFYGLSINGNTMNIQQDWSLSVGDFYSTIALKRLDGDLPDDMLFVTGIVRHLDDVTTDQKDDIYYNYTWGNQSFHKQDLGMAIISNKKYLPRYYNDKLSHVTIFDNSQSGVEYHFLSIWANGIGNVNTEERFKVELEHALVKTSQQPTK